MFAVNLFYVSVVITYWFNTCSGVHIISKEINLPLSEEVTIESPGYPRKNYERDTTYTWMVTAPDGTEEINIRIEMDVHEAPGFPCYDYLQIQEINTYFSLFKQCGKQTTERVARDNKLLITLYSNYDIFTAKGFRISLKVSKISTRATIKTTLAATTFPISTISITPADSKTTTFPLKTTFPHKSTTRSTQLIISLSKTSTRSSKKTTLASTSIPLSKISMTTATKTTTTTSPKSSFPHKTNSIIKTTISIKIPPTTKVTARKTIETTLPNQTATRQTTPKEITSEILSSTPTTWYRSRASLTLTAGETSKTTHVLKTTDLQRTINSERPNSSSTTQNALTTTEMVILMVGIGVVEVTIIIVGILAVKRFRQKKNDIMTRHSKEDDGRPVSRKTVCSIDNVYATIPEEEFDENPYKDLSEGVYDTTSKRRSHVNGNCNEYSRGSFYSRLFRSSKVSGGRPVKETQPMFSTFRGSKKETK